MPVSPVTGEGVNNITVCFFKDEEGGEGSPDPLPQSMIVMRHRVVTLWTIIPDVDAFSIVSAF